MDCLVAFPAFIEKMRQAGDEVYWPQIVTDSIQAAFDKIPFSEVDSLKLMAGSAQDTLYRHIMQLSFIDGYTYSYCLKVLRYFFSQLTARGIRTYYVLDNTLREDRLIATLELFAESGILPICPRYDGFDWEVLSTRIRAGLDHIGHVAYIEPDNEVNYLSEAKQMASDVPCVATFRNLAPDDPILTVISIQ